MAPASSGFDPFGNGAKSNTNAKDKIAGDQPRDSEKFVTNEAMLTLGKAPE